MNKVLKIILIIVSIIIILVGIVGIYYFIDQSSIIALEEYNIEGTEISVEVRNDNNAKLSKEHPLTISGSNGDVVFTIGETETSVFMMKLMLSEEMKDIVTVDKIVEERGMTYMICHIVGDEGKISYFCYGTIAETDKGFASDVVENKDLLIETMNNTTFGMKSIVRDFKLWIIKQFKTKL